MWSQALLNVPTGSRVAWRHGAVALCLALTAGIACDKVPLMAPTNSTITLFANASTVALNGTIEITATVIESAGTPVQNGTVVNFFTTLGTIDPPEVRTHNGRATARLHAGGQSGTATIRAASGGSTTRDPQLTIAVGSAGAAQVEIFATPASLPSGGGAVQILAVVYDAGGNRLAGVPVSFSADNGTVSPNTATTDGSGEARSAVNATVTTRVTATVVTGTTGSLSASVDVKLRPAPSVSIAVGTASPTEDQPVTFTFTVNPGTGGAAVRQASVQFGDGSSQNLSTNGTTSATHVYRDHGTYTVIATATDAAGEVTAATATVVVARQNAITVTLSYSPASPVKVAAVVAFTSTVTGATSIDRFEWDFGDGTTRTTSGGSTSHAFTAVGSYVVSVRVVTTDGRSGSAQTEIVIVQ